MNCWRFLFLAADTNGDGFLDKAEFLAFSHPEEDDNMKPHVLEQVKTDLFILVI